MQKAISRRMIEFNIAGLGLGLNSFTFRLQPFTRNSGID